MKLIYKTFIFIGILIAVTSCGTSKKIQANNPTSQTNYSNTSQADRITTHAKSFLGTKYKFGGTTKRGMDCSGLVYVSFLNEGISMPRVSREMATRGKRIKLKQAQIGDLLFFSTQKNRNRINHVGIVVSKSPNVKFIHSSTSRGVIISSINERYWNKAFVQARSLL